MALIKLNSCSCGPILVNTDSIETVFQIKEGNQILTRVDMKSNRWEIFVTDSIDSIYKKAAKNG